MSMIKKVSRMLVITLSLVMLFSMTAFAATSESEGNHNLKISMDKSSDSNKALRAPAPAVTSVTIEGGYIDSNGDVIIQVYIVGYGQNEIAKWDGNKVTLEDEDLIAGSDRVVYAFRQYYNCGTATVGTHTFTFSTTSINYPWNTLSVSAQFTIS